MRGGLLSFTGISDYGPLPEPAENTVGPIGTEVGGMHSLWHCVFAGVC